MLNDCVNNWKSLQKCHNITKQLPCFTNNCFLVTVIHKLLRTWTDNPDPQATISNPHSHLFAWITFVNFIKIILSIYNVLIYDMMFISWYSFFFFQGNPTHVVITCENDIPMLRNIIAKKMSKYNINGQCLYWCLLSLWASFQVFHDYHTRNINTWDGYLGLKITK